MNVLRRFRLVALLEGLSYLLLLFVAMPLKYLAALPIAVRVVGSLHGLLFLAFLAVLFQVVLEHGWSARRWLGALLASVVPFGTFVLDRSLQRDLEAYQRPAGGR